MKINKKFLQTIAAFQILIFHLWMPLTGSVVEQFIIKTGYMGVDLFFFVSAYSLAGREIDYGQFIKSRWLVLYGQFAFFVVLSSVVKQSFDAGQIIKSLTFVDLFERGGGAFLWFIPAILIMYLLYPLFLKWKQPWKVPIVLAVWIAAELFLYKVFSYSSIFIFTNRIPVILTGYIMSKKQPPAWTAGLLIPLSIVLLYTWGFNVKLNVPVRDMFYVLAIPAVIAVAIISRYIRRLRLLDILGGATLELYALQMIFGGRLFFSIYSVIKYPWLVNMLVILAMYAGATLLNGAYRAARGFIKKRFVKSV